MWSDRQVAWALFAAAVIIRVAALAFGHNADGDAVPRLLHSRAVVDEGVVYPTSVWLPGHFVFLSLPYALGFSSQSSAQLYTLIASAASVPVMFFLVNRFYGRGAAVTSALMLALCSLHVRMSVLSVAEGPFATFLLIGLLLFFRYLETGQLRDLVIGTISLAIASSMRLEGWFVPAALAAAAVADALATRGVRRTPWLRAGAYIIGAAAFPLSWSLFTYVAYGDALYLIREIHASADPRNIKNRVASLSYTLAFWPGILVFANGPLGAFLSAIGPLVTVMRRQAVALAAFTVAFLGISMYGYKGFVQARYGFLAVLLLLAFAGPALAFVRASLPARWAEAPSTERRLAVASVALAAVWLGAATLLAATNLGWVSREMRSVSPIPRFEPEVTEVDRWLQAHDARHTALAFYRISPAGPWLSLADDWYGLQHAPSPAQQTEPQQLRFATTPGELIAIVQRSVDGYVVVNADDVTAAQTTLAGASSDRLGLSSAPVFSNLQFAVIHWSRPRSDIGAIIDARRAGPRIDSVLTRR